MILARNVSHFIFPGLHTMYVLTIRGNSSQMTRKDKIDDFNLYKPYWPFKGVKILKKLAT